MLFALISVVVIVGVAIAVVVSIVGVGNSVALVICVVVAISVLSPSRDGRRVLVNGKSSAISLPASLVNKNILNIFM